MNVSQSPPLFYFICLVFFFVTTYLRIRYSNSPFVKRNLKKYLFLRELDKVYKPFLEEYFTFYNCLDSKQKLLFERRVQKFIDLKEFIPRGGLESVKPEMKAMIAGSAIQLTFGYPDIYFLHFWRILVYPDNYYSTISRRFHKGEVNRRGIIVLSWRSFKEGFSNPDDGRNLGFHEMAHALRLINIVENDEYDFYDRSVMKEFEKEARSEITRINNSPPGACLFRRYGTTNIDEFFSVAVECFFETPAELKAYNPAIYELLSKILKSDPVNLYSANKIKKIA